MKRKIILVILVGIIFLLPSCAWRQGDNSAITKSNNGIWRPSEAPGSNSSKTLEDPLMKNFNAGKVQAPTIQSSAPSVTEIADADDSGRRGHPANPADNSSKTSPQKKPAANPDNRANADDNTAPPKSQIEARVSQLEKRVDGHDAALEINQKVISAHNQRIRILESRQMELDRRLSDLAVKTYRGVKIKPVRVGNFPSGSAKLTGDMKFQIKTLANKYNEIAKQLEASVSLRLYGFADSGTGTLSRNQKLANQRAQNGQKELAPLLSDKLKIIEASGVAPSDDSVYTSNSRCIRIYAE
ncbi:MAG: hypothetical protein U9R06_01170 [Patescibacteria group bacterium]|nr:hypothetical protein [Patescibacteria group bacterium]